jgi:hypothetical protein
MYNEKYQWVKGKGMKPKYSAGSKVRIKSQGTPARFLDAGILQYENMTGEVIESASVVAFMVGPGTGLQNTGGYTTVYHYTVKINEEITLHDILEDCLEIVG